jgi:release factor glutamine methyltransferase
MHQKFDMIVSNPPYIPNADAAAMQSEVRDHEPHEALFGGPDGLDIVRRIADQATAFLCSNGLLLMEIGRGQAAQLADQFAPDKWDRPDFLSDLQGIPRTLSVRRK